MFQERQRLNDLRFLEDQARARGYNTIAGIDEAGRGPLAGPVVAVACVLPHDFFLAGVNDSKKLTPKKRESLFEEIQKDSRISFGVGIVGNETIDAINIYQATIRAMLLAVADLPKIPDLLLVDGMKLPSEPIPCEKIIRGDAKVLAIAAASVIAKVIRDRMMEEFHERWPEYGFDRHKGYATAFHMKAVEKYGPCSIHRQTFEPVKSIVSPQLAAIAR